MVSRWSADRSMGSRPAEDVRLRCWLNSNSPSGDGSSRHWGACHRTLARARARSEAHRRSAGSFGCEFPKGELGSPSDLIRKPGRWPGFPRRRWAGEFQQKSGHSRVPFRFSPHRGPSVSRSSGSGKRVIAMGGAQRCRHETEPRLSMRRWASSAKKAKSVY